MDLVFEGFERDEFGLALGPVFHEHRGPVQGLVIQIGPVFKIAAGKEVGFHEPEAAFFTGFPVGVTLFVADKAEPMLPGKGGHFRGNHRPGSGADEAGQIGVIDDALPGDVTPKHQRPM